MDLTLIHLVDGRTIKTELTLGQVVSRRNRAMANGKSVFEVETIDGGKVAIDWSAVAEVEHSSSS